MNDEARIPVRSLSAIRTQSVSELSGFEFVLSGLDVMPSRRIIGRRQSAMFETNLDRIKEQAEREKDENWAFRLHIKDCRHRGRGIDAIVSVRCICLIQDRLPQVCELLPGASGGAGPRRHRPAGSGRGHHARAVRAEGTSTRPTSPTIPHPAEALPVSRRQALPPLPRAARSCAGFRSCTSGLHPRSMMAL